MQNKPVSPLNSPEAAALLRDPTALRGLLQSPETKKLISMLRQQGDLSAAAQQAKSGNAGQLQAMLDQLGKSDEGGALLARLEQRLGK